MEYISTKKDARIGLGQNAHGELVFTVLPNPGRFLSPDGATVVLEPASAVRLALELLAGAGREVTLEQMERLKKPVEG